MISFVTLFLGLVLGTQVVEVAVKPEVATVELLLDDKSLGTLSGPPWRLEANLGETLLPRRLTARAFDQHGARLGETEQWLNLPRPEAEVSLVLEGGQPGAPARARVAWESLVAREPQAVHVTIDGKPIAVADPRAFTLPPLDPERLHYLRLELDFSDTVSTVLERVFGGTYTDEVTADLTSLPLLLPKKAPLPTAEQMTGWLTSRGQSLEIVAVERGTAEIVVVRDANAPGALERIQRDMSQMMRIVETDRLGNGRFLRDALPLAADQRLRFLAPYAEKVTGTRHPYALFPSSAEFMTRDGGLYWLLAKARARRPRDSRQQLADALAVAGMSASAQSRRRAALLVLGRAPEDESQLSPAAVRGYLAALRVPLRVWAADRLAIEPTSAWAPAVDVSSGGKLSLAADELLELLDRQIIVWVRGTHLPQWIELAPDAPVRFAE